MRQSVAVTERPPLMPDPGPAPRVMLRILATSDLHLQIYPHDYRTDRPAPGTGLALAARLITRLRAAAPNSLLFDNGDFLQGNPMGDFVAETRGLPPGRSHPMIRAMNRLGYDGATLGNHEFNYGLDFLGRALRDACFPLVSANLFDPRSGAPLFAPHAMIDRVVVDTAGRRWPLRVAVTGFLPPQVVEWDHRHLGGRAVAAGITETARRIVPELRAAGADVVVALCHCGIDPGTEGAGNAALELARVAGVDAVVAGHSHQVFPGPDFARLAGADVTAGTLHGVPAAMPGHSGSHVGVIDLLLERGPRGWHRLSGRGRALPARRAECVAGNGADPCRSLMALTERDHRETLGHMRRAAGHSVAPLHTYFALAGDGGAVRLVARALIRHVEGALADSDLGGLPVLAAAAPFRAGGRGGPANYTDIPQGALTLRHLADLCAYPNSVSALVLRGAELRAWLEHAAAAFHTIVPGTADQPLIDPGIPAYNFDLIEGVSYRIDPTRPPGGRIRGLRFRGRPVAAEDRFVLATGSHRAVGGGGFPGSGPGAIVYDSGPTLREAVAAYLADTGAYTPPADPVWRFVDLPGTSALFDTGPGAAAHPPAPGTERIGPAETGFLRYRLRFG